MPRDKESERERGKRRREKLKSDPIRYAEYKRKKNIRELERRHRKGIKYPHTENSKKRLNERSKNEKISILTIYGRGRLACVQCGESRLECLSIDHINNDGAKDHSKYGIHIYWKLKKLGYPLGYQTLCMNCQFIKNAEYQKIKKLLKPIIY
jgi:hypothetical protein